MKPSTITIKKSKPENRRLQPTGQLNKEDILIQYADILKAWVIWVLQCIFQVDTGVQPVQMPYIDPDGKKREKEKEALDRYVEASVMAKVNESIPWCSNTLIRETTNKFRICIHLSQTLHKAILRPKHPMPTLNEQLHKLSTAKYFSLVDALNGFHQIPLNEESFRKYRWLRMPFGITLKCSRRT
jgi:hypothetical protein